MGFKTTRLQTQSVLSCIGKVLAVTGCIGGLSAGCMPNSAVEQDFGKSVRQMQFVQAYDKTTINNPSLRPVMGMDGTLNGNVLAEYRKNVSSPKQTQQAIIFTVSGGQSSMGGR